MGGAKISTSGWRLVEPVGQESDLSIVLTIEAASALASTVDVANSVAFAAPREALPMPLSRPFSFPIAPPKTSEGDRNRPPISVDPQAAVAGVVALLLTHATAPGWATGTPKVSTLLRATFR